MQGAAPPPGETRGGAAETRGALLAANPHCLQLGGGEWRQFFTPEPVPEPYRELGEDLPRMPYRRRPREARSCRHWGQLKLLVAEVEFLTEFALAPPPPPAREWLVVYAGAAPGDHIPFLAGLFPACRFELYDPAPFCPGVARAPRVRAERALFTEERAAALAGRGDVLFISDIRTLPPPRGGAPPGDDDGDETAEVQRFVRGDMARQRGWVERIRPAASLLKMRLPWGGGATPYLPGRVRVQAFGPPTTTETRLVTTRAELGGGPALYDNLAYEERLMFHNSVARARLHGLAPLGPREARRVPGLDRCFDCATLVRVFRGFLAAAGGGAEPSPGALAALLAAAVAGAAPRRGRSLAGGPGR